MIAAAILTSCRKEDAVDSAKLPEKSKEPEETAVWVRRSGLTARGEQAVVALKSAGMRGLRAEDYTAGLEQPTEEAIANNLAKYAVDVRRGRINPGYYKEEIPTKEELLAQVAAEPDGVEAGLRKLDPPFAGYQRLVEALGRARRDGTPPEQIAQMELTLEKWRWLPRTYARGPIMVNLPEYRLRALDDKLQVALEMKVVIGQITHPTPQFMGQMTYVVFAPFWHVPPNILKRELVPDVEKDRKYLAARSYEVLTEDGKVLGGEVSDETLAGLKAGSLRVRQKPGTRNALGKVKFMFPNQDNIYLHDTNAPNLFAKEERAFSHGCVRVEIPQVLAEWVLHGNAAWPAERVHEALESGKQKQANLSRAMPVLMLYHTVTVDTSGTVQFHKDVYHQDDALLKKMAAR
jgi:murein L,D-transpeptidase YcbB/YkuD